MSGARELVSGHVTSKDHPSVISISYPESSSFWSAGELPEGAYTLIALLKVRTDRRNSGIRELDDFSHWLLA